jgi:hypothetical protein
VLWGSHGLHLQHLQWFLHHISPWGFCLAHLGFNLRLQKSGSTSGVYNPSLASNQASTMCQSTYLHHKEHCITSHPKPQGQGQVGLPEHQEGCMPSVDILFCKRHNLALHMVLSVHQTLWTLARVVRTLSRKVCKGPWRFDRQFFINIYLLFSIPIKYIWQFFKTVIYGMLENRSSPWRFVVACP